MRTLGDNFILDGVQIWVGMLFFFLLLGSIVGLVAVGYQATEWAWYRSWLEMFADTGQERYLAFVVLPTATAIAGALTAVGLDHVVTEENAAPGWAMFAGGIVMSFLLGLLMLYWLSGGPSGSARTIRAAISEGKNVDEAVAILNERLKHFEERRRKPTNQPAEALGPVEKLVIFIVACLLMAFVVAAFYANWRLAVLATITCAIYFGLFGIFMLLRHSVRSSVRPVVTELLDRITKAEQARAVRQDQPGLAPPLPFGTVTSKPTMAWVSRVAGSVMTAVVCWAASELAQRRHEQRPGARHHGRST